MMQDDETDNGDATATQDDDHTTMAFEVVESRFTCFFSDMYISSSFIISFLRFSFPCMLYGRVASLFFSNVFQCYLHLCTNGI